jgi:GT2 family glycosyltransferase
MVESSSQPRVSVVFATYNRQDSAARLLTQLAAQQLAADDFEVVVVDDGSREDPTQLLRAVPMPCKVTIIRQPNAGAAAARDRGINEARGHIIVIVDDDMQVEPGFLSAHLAYHERHARCVVLGHIKPDPSMSMPLFSRYHSEMLARFVAAARNGKLQIRGTQVCTGNLSFCREDYFAVGGFDREMRQSEDAELGVRLDKSGCHLVFGEDAATLHGSDHESVQFWIRRALRYGTFDFKISRKHADAVWTNPFRFLFAVHPISRPLLLAVPLIPAVGEGSGRAVMTTAEVVDRIGAERLAIAGATLAYGLFYFTGVRRECGSAIGYLRQCARYVGERRRAAVVARAGE